LKKREILVPLFLVKKAIFIIGFILIFAKVFGQFGFCASGSSVNLVCNPSFEYYISCPQTLSEINNAYDWYDAGVDPDYFHAATAGTYVGVPKNMFGYQNAHSGNGMAGMGTFMRAYPPSTQNAMEFIGTKLIDTLVIGQKYYLSMYVSFAEMLQGYQKIASNKTGMRFSTKPSGGWAGKPLLNNFDHLHTNLVISDTLNWYRISGSFIADSAYSHLTLGNFCDYLHLDTLVVGTPVKYGLSWSYYYVDDVCVSIDSLTCSEAVGIREQQKYFPDCKIYPNPAINEINVEVTEEGNYMFEIYNLLGEEIIDRRFLTKSKIDISQLSNGTYFYLIKKDNTILKADKLIITH